jgi:hypothetical protein
VFIWTTVCCVVVLLGWGCSALERYDETSGCSDQAQTLADKIADDYEAESEPHCSYGTIWLVLSDGDQVTYNRVLGQLQADGWQIDSSRAGEDYGRLLPPESEQLADRGPLGTSISFEPSRFLIELNAGYGMPWPANN